MKNEKKLESVEWTPRLPQLLMFGHFKLTIFGEYQLHLSNLTILKGS